MLILGILVFAGHAAAICPLALVIDELFVFLACCHHWVFLASAINWARLTTLRYHVTSYSVLIYHLNLVLRKLLNQEYTLLCEMFIEHLLIKHS